MSATEAQLRDAIARLVAQGPADTAAHVVDLSDGHVVLDYRGREKLPAASFTKLYTAAAALTELGPRARVVTRVLGSGRRNGSTWEGDLYLRGGGDFTFGTRAFARKAYGVGGGVERLAARLRRSGLRRVRGRVLADVSLFGDNGGAPFLLALCPAPLFGPGCPYGPAGRMERPMPNGPRTPIGFNRGLLSETSVTPQARPDRFAARGLTRALENAGISVAGRPGAARTPRPARVLAATRSPAVERLVALATKPSDNYAAEILFRVLGARLAGDGSREGGARVVRRSIRKRIGFAPEIVDGSGESVKDRSSPREIVALLAGMRERKAGSAFARSLSRAGRNGTLLRFAGSVAEGRCLLKDGTRVDADVTRNTLNITGYCTTVSGRTFAFAVMMNGMPIELVGTKLESYAYELQDTIVRLLAGYRG